MMTSRAGALALLLLASPSFASIPLRWAPALRETLPQITGGRAGEVAANMDGLVVSGLGVKPGTLSTLSRVGITDLEGLDGFLRAPDYRARAKALGVAARDLESLRLSLDVLSPVVRRLQLRRLTPDSSARASFGVSLAIGLEDQAEDSNHLARLALVAPLDANGGKRASASLSESLRRQQPYIDAQLREALADTGLLPSQTVAVAGVPDRNEMRDAVADLPPRTVLGRLRAAWARVKTLLTSY